MVHGGEQRKLLPLLLGHTHKGPARSSLVSLSSDAELAVDKIPEVLQNECWPPVGQAGF